MARELDSFKRSPRKTVGYLTGVFDLLHQAHLQYLETAKSFCDTLIVGLTTDQRCAQEKRVPYFNYDHRKALLLGTKWVDQVIANTGQTKQDMYRDLQFDVLFTTDEYKGRPEFTSFVKDFPHVRLVIFPKFSETIHTSHLIRQLTERTMHSFQIMAWGITGPVFYEPSNKTVIKMVNVSGQERGNTKNCFNMPPTGARNWKRKNEEHVYPNLCGINAEREVEIDKYLQGKPWYTVKHIRIMIDQPDQYPSFPNDPKFHHVVKERMQHPVRVYWVYQRHAGITLKKWIHEYQSKPDFTILLAKIVKRVHDICDELLTLKVVHGDIHHENICIDKDIVSLIDWGWCNHPAFDHDDAEHKYLQCCLQKQFDWKHFIQSLQYGYEMEPWFNEFKVVLDREMEPELMEQEI